MNLGKVTLVVGLCLTLTHIFSQDLVITSKGDSVKCQITKVTKSQIYFNYRSGTDLLFSVMPLGLVKGYTQNFFGNDYSNFIDTTPKTNFNQPSTANTQIAHAVKSKYPDLIIKKNGDSLQCRIIEFSESFVSFSFESSSKNEFTTQLDLSEVKEYTYNWYKKISLQHKSFSTFLFHFNLGLGYRTAEAPDDQSSQYEKHVDGLRLGFVYNIGLTLFPSEEFGIGFEYRSHNSSQSTSGISIYNPSLGSTVYGTLSEKIHTSFIGPVLKFRTIDPYKKDVPILGFGIGRLGYRNNSEFMEEFSIEGKTLGVLFDFSYDLPLDTKAKNFIGFQLSFTGGVLKEVNVSQGSNKQTIKLDKESYENLARLDLSVGFRFGN